MKITHSVLSLMLQPPCYLRMVHFNHFKLQKRGLFWSYTKSKRQLSYHGQHTQSGCTPCSFDQAAPNPARALRRSIETLHTKKVNLQKNAKRDRLKLFLDEPFHLPSHEAKKHSIKKPPPTILKGRQYSWPVRV